MSTPAPRRSAVITLLTFLVLTAVAATAAQTAQALPRDTHAGDRRDDQSTTDRRTTVAAAPGHAYAASPRDTSAVVIAHRGASAYAPENTLAAVRLGVAMDADLVEVDVQETKDHRLVIMHDTTLDRTTNVEKVFPDRAPWRVGDFTLAEVKRLDAGSWMAKKYRGEPVPTLGEVLLTLQGTSAGLMLEAKEPALYPGVGKRIVDEMARYPYWRDASDASRLVVVSFDWEFQREFRELAPDYPIGLIGTPEKGQLDDLATWAEFVDPTYDDLSTDLVDAIHDAGMSTFTWTVNDGDQARKALDYGVDGIVTNNPDVVRKQVRKSRAA